MDFADALHLGRAEACEAFLTFDNRLRPSKASAQGFDNVRVPLGPLGGGDPKRNAAHRTAPCLSACV